MNLGILAHVDAGKTTLTERLLFTAGAIDAVGSVDDGNTTTDSLALERQRGITIKSAVASFMAGDVPVNLIDTPGHPDFIAEVERVLGVLDGAVLVVSAVEGVQAQTRVLMRALKRLRLPTLIFVNKVDRAGADVPRVLDEIRAKLTPSIVPMGADPTEVLAEHDETLLAAYVGNRKPGEAELAAALASQSRRGLVHPVFSGSAMKGRGIEELIDGIAALLPGAGGDPDGPLQGTVFKVERSPAGEKIAYVRLFNGTLNVRDRVGDAKVTAIEGGSVRAGEIGKVWGLAGVRIGDHLGEVHERNAVRFAPPTLETVVDADDRGRLHAALAELAEQDPLINLRQGGERQEISLSLYGEVQKEVIQATLADEYGVEVTFSETTTICAERPTGPGAAVRVIGEDGNPYLATVGLRVDPGAGVVFRLEVELGSLPPAFMKAIEETVRATLLRGPQGWEVGDVTVTLTHSGYWARQSHAHGSFDKSMSSTAGDFRSVTRLVLMEALRRAGTRVLEPMHRFHLEIPPDALGPILPVLSRLRAVPETTTPGWTLEGVIPAAQVHELRQLLPTLTHGEGVLESAFDHYRPVARNPVSMMPRL
ncbi:GTP-binding protein [Nonomuraea sp. NPDC050556]|uniref:GTP-binding protein n=1 Tax=Nonomuraea sp. NPDC050556 TaxID=3364369 RepID=UPI0037AE896C